ncbi:TMV resistance protein N [Artemisia annua]|uniref:TMV resistance protein N n=1 Tax=Artemisia annua TaxID=35608 RepID=A0A2U1PCH9_ARTAN|nr:TMV resistance protein N [Artemisia annua]
MRSVMNLSLESGRRDEEQLIRKIMKDVRKMKNPQQLCNVEHPVGIDSRAQDVISALRLSSIVAVLGISGSDFNLSCFIQDINSYVYRGPNWKADLQKDVVSCLTGNDKFIASHNDGAAMIKKLISGQKLFLVLDDVYTFEQLQALSIHSASFHCESRIIVTTRNTQSLSNLQHTSYIIKLLDTRESFELFTRLIGKGDHIQKKFIDEIVKRSGGIPLVLEVWSRHFIDYDKKLWPSILETLKRIPHEDTQKKLRISYDSLPKRAQNLFLDIACFFNGMNKNFVVKVLQDEDFFPDVETQIQNLVHKLLVKNDSPLLVSLHDVIREMGQEVVRQENEDEPGKRTRLMGYRDVVHVLGDCLGTDSVRSIQLESYEKKEWVTVQLEALKKMSSLRFIMLRNFKLQWSSSSNDNMSACFCFKHLKYLEWQWFPCKSLDNFDMGNVVVIKLQYSKLEKLWEGVKNFKKLKILNVSNSNSLTKIGNFTGLENLEQLSLYGCETLEELDSSIGCLQKLIELDLSYCTRLKSLPWKSIGKLTSLLKLKLLKCHNVLEISNEVGSLISLKHLDLCYNIFSSLPNSLCQLHQLTKIKLSGCTNLKSIPDLPPSIKKLHVQDCINLVNLPSNCSELKFLTLLGLGNCSKLGPKGFKQVTGLSNLQYLGMENCNVSEVSSKIRNLVSLRFLDLSRNTFSSLPESFSNLSQLKRLLIHDCSELKLLPPIPSQLTDIEAANCCSLNVMPFDSMQMAYIFPSKESQLTITKGLYIGLPAEELPEWCTYRNSGNVLSFVAPVQFDSKIRGLILCDTREKDKDEDWVYPVIYNKTKGTMHRLNGPNYYMVSRLVMFYPLIDTTLVVEAGDTVEVKFDDKGSVLKDVREPLFPTSEMSAGTIQLSGNDDVHVNEDGLITHEEICTFPV